MALEHSIILQSGVCQLTQNIYMEVIAFILMEGSTILLKRKTRSNICTVHVKDTDNSAYHTG